MTPLLLLIALAADPADDAKAKAAAAQKRAKTAFTDAGQAGRDARVQGEYQGKLLSGGQLAGYGAQVVAQGDGKFTLRMVPGGLPGSGGDGPPGPAVVGTTVETKPQVNVTTFAGPGFTARVEDFDTLRVTQEGKEFLMQRVERHSPTEGAKPPAGAVVLFDGSSADGWEGGKLVGDKFLKAGATSKKQFGSGTVHVEFRTPLMPYATGQGRGNSGVYLQGRYEVQVLDSFGNPPANNEAGGVYELHVPKLNASYPPLQWQTYDIDFTAATYDGDTKVKDGTVTVRHNGVLVQDAVPLPRATRAAVRKEGPEKGPLYLQDHGDPVAYRNVWVVEK